MNILQEMGIKDLERVCIKTRNDIVLGNRKLEAGEPVLYFENIQISLLNEIVTPIFARGGWGNSPFVIWEDRNETTFSFSCGTMNPISFNLLLGADMLEKENGDILFYNQIIELNENGEGELKFSPLLSQKNFYYIYERGNIQKRINPISIENNKIIFGKEYPYNNIMCDYYFTYDNNNIIYQLKRERFNNLYFLEATFFMKDENDGILHSGLLIMPKVKIISNINLKVGQNTSPMVSNFNIIAMPDRKNSNDATICEIKYLDEDIIGY